MKRASRRNWLAGPRAGGPGLTGRRVEGLGLRGNEWRDGCMEDERTAAVPWDGFESRRLIRLAVDRAFVAVREEVENNGKLGRI